MKRSLTPASRRRSAIPFRAPARDVELLEARRLLTGDVNGNGVRDPEEPALQGWTVYVDFNRNAAQDPGEPSAVSNVDGEALIAGVTANTWDVRARLIVERLGALTPNRGPEARA